MAHWTIRNRTRGTIVAQHAELASSWLARLRGLIGRQRLGAGEALIISPCNSIHTLFMAFPIQVLFVGEGNVVLRTTLGVAPWRIGPIVPQARYVIELPRGSIEASKTVAGDTLDWVPWTRGV